MFVEFVSLNKKPGRYIGLRKNLKPGEAETAAEILGCRPKRHEFETEFLNDTEIEISHLEFDDNDKLTTVTAVEDVGSKEAADQMCALSSLFEAQGITVSCSGSKVTIKGFEKMTDSEDEDDVKMVGLTKEEFKKAMEEESEGQVTCK